MAIFDFFSRFLGGTDNSGLEQIFRGDQAAASAASQSALSAQALATQDTLAALVNPIDSEAARKASEARQRQLRRDSDPVFANTTPAPVSFKMLMGQ